MFFSNKRKAGDNAKTFPNKKAKYEGKSPKRREIKQRFTQTLIECDQLIKRWLQEGDFDSIFEALGLLERGGRFLNIEAYLKHTHYFLFDWALENAHGPLLNYFLEKTRPEQRLLLVSHDEYAPLKKFIDKVLALPEEDYLATSTSKIPLLNALFAIGPEIKKTALMLKN